MLDSETPWITIARYKDWSLAHIELGYLQSEGIEARLLNTQLIDIVAPLMDMELQVRWDDVAQAQQLIDTAQSNE